MSPTSKLATGETWGISERRAYINLSLCDVSMCLRFVTPTFFLYNLRGMEPRFRMHNNTD
jgi:hypothetical protein